MKRSPGYAANRIAVALAIAAGPGIILPASASAANMTAAQIEEKVIGRTLGFETDSGLAGEIHYAPAGTSTIEVDGLFSDKGTWRFNGDEFCTRWDIIRDGEEKCTDFHQVDETTFEVSDGTKVWYETE